jgi:hypothetical protein
MDFDEWLAKAWDEHAGAAAAVAARIGSEGLALARSDSQLAALSRLAHHVMGEHLARWAEGRELLARLVRSPAAGPASAVAQRVFDASLALAGALGDARPALEPSERIRVTAHASGALAERDPVRAATLLDDAAADFNTCGLPDSDPACRVIAINGNNIACTIEEKPSRTDAERDLMLNAARLARDFWARAGTWLEVERAEYRLAMSHLKAGELPAARRHARRCLDALREHDAPALEWFFGHEALALIERAAGHADAQAQAVLAMKGAFDRLDEGDKAWCRATLDKVTSR